MHDICCASAATGDAWVRRGLVVCVREKCIQWTTVRSTEGTGCRAVVDHLVIIVTSRTVSHGREEFRGVLSLVI
jgi:hypothetical protein